MPGKPCGETVVHEVFHAEGRAGQVPQAPTWLERLGQRGANLSEIDGVRKLLEGGKTACWQLRGGRVQRSGNKLFWRREMGRIAKAGNR